MLSMKEQIETHATGLVILEENTEGLPPLDQEMALFKYIEGRVWQMKGRVLLEFILRADTKTRRLKEPMNKVELAEVLGCSPRTVYAALRELIDKKWLVCARRADGSRSSSLDVYEIWCDIRPGETYPLPPNGRSRQMKPRKKLQS